MSINRETTSDRVFGICCYVFATILMLIVLYPLWYIVICSVSDPYAVGAGKVWLWPVGFNVDGYARVFRDKNIMTGYGNTIFYTVTGTLLNLTLTLTAVFAVMALRSTISQDFMTASSWRSLCSRCTFPAA